MLKKSLLVLMLVVLLNPGWAVANQAEFIAGGSKHTLGIKSDGTVWAWGGNSDGQLGNGGTTQQDEPVPVTMTDLESVKAVACGNDHSIALKTDGTVWTWGANLNGQLGYNTYNAGTDENDDQTTPAQVTDTHITGVKAIAGGSFHTVVLKEDGTVWAWGFNDNGQLGNNSNLSGFIPVQVVIDTSSTPLENVEAIAAGVRHSVALKADGTVWTWGWNYYGQLGNGEAGIDGIPNQGGDIWIAQQVTTGAEAIAAGASFTLAIKSGAVYAWGQNSKGQLGIGTTNLARTPVATSILTADVIAIAAGGEHSLALKTDGTVWAWGYNNRGQLGDDSITQRNSPVQSELSDFGTSIAAGSEHSMALCTNDLYTWGYDNDGQLGDAASGNQQIPINITGVFGFLCDINGDGKYDLADIIVGLQIVVDLPVSATINVHADINDDGKIGLQEVLGRMENEAGLR